ncbi:hypothetical protein [Kitasatospora sp. NPDC056181]|uniref:hypothetical protein n=1 Tax=Kitasatospora sp. NPDC056181 TaxID=3345737 RepID=UPI0035D9B358
MSRAPEPGPNGPVPQESIPRPALLALRTTTTSLAVLTLAQATFAGSFLSGRYEMLMVHRTNALVIAAVSLGQTALGVLIRGSGYGPNRLIWVPALVAAAVIGQTWLGFARVLGVHVTLGVLIVSGVLGVARWSWRTPLPPRTGHGRQTGAGESAGVAS